MTPKRSFRTFWYADDLTITNEPLVLSLLKYRQKKNRRKMSLAPKTLGGEYGFPNLVSSITQDGKQLTIIDMDLPTDYCGDKIIIHATTTRFRAWVLRRVWAHVFRQRV